MGSQTILLQAITAQMICDGVLEWGGEEVLKKQKNLAHNRRLQGGNPGVHHVGGGSKAETVMHPAEAKVRESLHNDDGEDEPAQTAVCAYVASNLQREGNRGSWKPLQQEWKMREKKDPR